MKRVYLLIPTDNQVQIDSLLASSLEKAKTYGVASSFLPFTTEALPKITEELSKVYVEVLSVNAVLNRINSNDDVIKNRIEYEKEKILNKIQVFNQGGEAATQRYYKSIHGTGDLTTVNVSRNIYY